MSRTFIAFHVNGHIPTIAALDAICEAAIEGDMLPDDDGQYANAEDIKWAFADALIELPREDRVRLVRDESYTDNADALKAACQEHGVACTFAYDGDHEFPAGSWAFLPGEGVFESDSNGDDAVIPVKALRHALAENDLHGLREIVAKHDKAGGAGQPKLTASQEVLDHLRDLKAEG